MLCSKALGLLFQIQKPRITLLNNHSNIDKDPMYLIPVKVNYLKVVRFH